MITLITGAPGSGKTLYCIDKLIQPLIGTHVDGRDDDGGLVRYERLIYTNINGLLLDHELIDKDWLELLHENHQPGMVVVFDEVQRVWPNRPHGSKKPPAVEYLETHRHDGIDVVLLTQNPQLLDPAVRALVGRHLHMRRVGGIGAAIVYEWDGCSNALNFKAAFTKTPYRYSRKVFKLYKSARVHTKQKRKLPFAVWMALAGIVGSLALWPQLGARLQQRSAPAQAQAVKSTPGAVASSSPGPASSSPARSGKEPPLTLAEYKESLRSRLPGLTFTAPRYDQLTQPTRVQVPAACIQSRKQGCQCWDQDANRMWVPELVCAGIVANGLWIDFEPEGPRGRRDAPVNAQTVRWTQDGYQEPAQITAADIAAHSRATTGGNPWARNAGPAQAETTTHVGVAGAPGQSSMPGAPGAPAAGAPGAPGAPG